MEFLNVPYVHNLLDYLHQHPHIGGIITFLIAFLESLAVIGAIIPGSVTMTAIGVMIGSGIMPLTGTLLWAVFGAFCGDFLSYWVGAHFNERVRNIWPFRKYPNMLVMGENFFRKHGGKSVVIGRFFGPVRSAVPLIAGLMHMSRLRFALAALPSAALWSIVYIMPGYIVGTLSLELPPATATKFILVMLGLVAFGWIFFVLIHLFFKTIARIFDKTAARLWQYLATHKSAHWITTVLSNPSRVNPHRQLLLLFSTILFGLLFLRVFFSVVHHSGLTYLNEPLFELFRSLRSNTVDHIMIPASLLGNHWVLLPLSLIVAGFLFLRRYYWTTMIWLMLIALSLSSIELIKHYYYEPRPIGLFYVEISSAFPSSPVLLVTTLFGFLAQLIAEGMAPSRRSIPYFFAVIIVIMVGVAQLYLGAHWFTDLLASLFLGLSLLFLIILFHRRYNGRVVPVKSFSLIVVVTLLACWFAITLEQFRKMQDDYTLYWPKLTLTAETWWTYHNQQIPLFVVSRLGKPQHVINIQWLGSLNDIQQPLIKNGWKVNTLQLNLKNTLHRLSASTNPQHLPLLPTLFQNRAPVFVLTKTEAGKQLNLMVWKSNVTMEDTSETLWLGSLYYYMPRTKHLQVSAEQMHELYQNAVKELMAALPGYHWQVLHLTFSQQPPIMSPLNWDGTLLLIRGGNPPLSPK